jgi:Uncharacterized conserved protein
MDLNRLEGVFYKGKGSMRLNWEEVKAKIEKWVKEEKLSANEVLDVNAFFNFAITVGANRVLNVLQNREKKDSILIGTNVLFGEKEKDSFRSKTRIERMETLSRLRFTLASIDVSFYIDMENNEIPKSVRIQHPIYYDALTKDRFMHGVFTVLKALELCSWVVVESL